MKPQRTFNVFLWILATLTGLVVRLDAQVLNGDFSSGMTNWTFIRIPSGDVLTGAITSVDIDGLPLGLTDALKCQAGLYDGRALMQTVFLTNGVTYDFAADLAEESGSNNGDGGTVSVYLGSTLVTSYAWGSVPWHVKLYTNLFGAYAPQATGPEILTITFTRPWGAGPDTPWDYIDNIQLSAEPCALACPSNIVATTDPGQCGAVVSFPLAITLGPCSNAIVTCRPPSGSSFPVGTTTVSCSFDDNHTCSFTVTVEDHEPPTAECRRIQNASGKLSPAPNNKRSDFEGFYQLLARDNCDQQPAIYVADSASSFVAGPFQNGDTVKIVQSPGGTPSQSSGPKDIAAHIQIKGQALIFAVDASGNISSPVGCGQTPVHN